MLLPFAFTSSNRRYRYPSVAAALILIVSAAVACGGSSSPVSAPEDDEPSPPLSFTAIQGDWEGVIQRPFGGVSRWGDVSIARDSARQGQVVGTFEYYVSKDGELLCIAELLARTSSPPTYVFAYTATFGQGNEACEEGGLFKYVHDVAAEELVYFYKAPEAENFVEWGTFSRSG